MKGQLAGGVGILWRPLAQLVLFGTRNALRQTLPDDRTMTTSGVILQPTDVVGDLDVLFDGGLSMKQQVNRVTVVTRTVVNNTTIISMAP